MTTIRVETLIAAPIERCFDLARSQSAHVASTAETGERIVQGPAHDLLELGDEITFEARHFGVRQRLTAVIVEFDRPSRFVDQMTRGAFRSFWHEHRFVSCQADTQMIDTVKFESPGGALGPLVERLFLKRYLQRFIYKRAQELKTMAESSVQDGVGATFLVDGFSVGD